MLRHDQAGVTLVELVVILAIISVLGVALFSSLGNVLQVTESKGAAEQVAASIRLARQYAITRGENHCISFSGSPNTNFQITVAPNNTTCTGAVVQSATTIGHGLAIVNPANLAIIFDGIGVVRNFAPSNPTVTVQVDTQPHSCRYDVLVTLHGGVRVSEGAC
jgi:Tfp pilus assembly protein FimT